MMRPCSPRVRHWWRSKVTAITAGELNLRPKAEGTACAVLCRLSGLSSLPLLKMILVVREREPLLKGSRTLQVMLCDKQKATALPDPMRPSAANFAAEQSPKMQQRGDRPLERSCRSLNENVTSAVLIKSCAERSLDDGVKRAPIVCECSYRQ